MSDLRAEEIREALAQHDDGEAGTHQYDHLARAARAYLASLEQEPDYEAAHVAQHAIWCDCGDIACHPSAGTEVLMDEIKVIVDAALAGFRSQPKGDNK